MKKSSRFAGLAFMVAGALLIVNNLGQPRIEALHVPDVVKLVASGGLLTIGFLCLIGRF